ncbi:hypothetical protein ABMA79_05300 [Halobacteriovorax sp. HFRX-2_2]|uniref:hypothetical protein n=1 Tax=unclassified Halobacteriovorax TaxID=2639665 RepID=UPI003717A96B
MRLLIILLITFKIFASEPTQQELKFSPSLSPMLKNLVTELYLNSKINQEYIIGLSKNLTSPLDNDFIELMILNSILNTKLNKQYEHVNISQALYNELDQNIKSIEVNLPFSKTISAKILKDIGELLTNRNLREYNAYIKNRDLKVSPELKAFMNRISYLQYWIDTLRKPSSVRNATLLKTNLEILNSLNRNLSITAATYKKDNDISYISINDIDLIKARRQVDKLLFNNAPDKDPDYKAPQELPEPVENWE